ncbi:hypothetical protein ACE1ET_10520 [Saccharicrinis sp. FJH62]|uniref:hypothetical protein n=1 Tax=Saccharicrinis sp. FJH62 TaxID=3344657 RepID=UPI0035D40CA4
MFEELSQYPSDQFIFRPCDLLEEVCNAPKESCGIFLIYELNEENSRLVYIGSSNKMSSASCKPGLFEKIVHAEDYDGVPGKIFFYMNLIKSDAEGLNFHWYETTNDEPEKIADLLVRKYSDVHGNLPDWNL